MDVDDLEPDDLELGDGDRLTGPGPLGVDAERDRVLAALRLVVAARPPSPALVAARPRGAAVIPIHAGARVDAGLPPAT